LTHDDMNFMLNILNKLHLEV